MDENRRKTQLRSIATRLDRLIDLFVSHFFSCLGTSFSMNVPLNGLRGAVWYAVYVSFTSNANTVGLYSKISYFKTKPRQPEPILNLRGEGLSDTSIELIWQPPLKPNGEIATYLVYYMPLEDRIPVNNTNVLCLMKGEA